MPKTITISEELFARLESLARPFVDQNPEDVIVRLLDGKILNGEITPASDYRTASRAQTKVENRAPRERGVVIELNSEKIAADTVPDLFTKIMEYLHSKKLWEKVEKLAPYKTSSKRYLFSKTPKHPNGNDFFVPINYRNLYMETHKNYKTTIEQLSRFLEKVGVNLVYKGS